MESEVLAPVHILTPLAGIALGAVLIFSYSVLGRWLGHWALTAPIMFMLVGWAGASLIGVAPAQVELLKVLAEATLALVLFTDAAGVRPRQIGDDRGPVARLLFIALPLTIVAGVAVAALLFPTMPWPALLLVAAMLAPTDAALGAATVLNPKVPVRIRRILNVESGLNDGLATPVVLFAIAAWAGQEGLSPKDSAVAAVVEIVLGVVYGVIVGFGGGRLLRIASTRHLVTRRGAMVAVLMMPLIAYTVAGLFDGNGFIAAFVAGTAYAAAWRGEDGHPMLDAAETIAEPMGDATWLIFGVLVVPLLLVDLSWQEVAFAVLSLTVLRMVPVALSLLGTGFRPPTLAFIGWFGPRGLASVVFSLIALESLEIDESLRDVLGTATLTIFASVVLHGVSARWGANSYAAWARRTKPKQETAEAEEPRPYGRTASAISEATVTGG